MKANLIVINQFGEFLTDAGTFKSEYPDATVFGSASACKKAMRTAKQSKRYCASYIMIENYGQENKTETRIG